jgi:threonine synthase
MREIRVFGATVSRVEGVGHDAASTREVADRLAEVCVAQGFLPMLTAFHYSPEAMQGVKTIAYELAEQAPDLTVVYVPVGGGGLLTGLHLGYSEMAAEGVVSMPRLVGVQPAGGAALVRAMDGHPEGLDGPLTTSISGLQMATLYDTTGAVEAVRSTRGHVVTVTDEDIWATQSELASRRGILVEPAGATAMAGLLSDARAGRLTADDRVAVILSGAGYKDAAALERLAGDVTVPHIPLSDLTERLAATTEVTS